MKTYKNIEKSEIVNEIFNVIKKYYEENNVYYGTLEHMIETNECSFMFNFDFDLSNEMIIGVYFNNAIIQFIDFEIKIDEDFLDLIEIELKNTKL